MTSSRTRRRRSTRSFRRLLVVLALAVFGLLLPSAASGTHEPGHVDPPPILDSDSDGVLDVEDNCPADANPGQTDSDGDGIGDACDRDRDGDDVANEADNCPGDANGDQVDSDKDGSGDACDPDDDGDRVDDGADRCPAAREDADGFEDDDGCPDTPETRIDSGPSGTVTSDSATFTFSASEPSQFECKLDGGAFSSCASPKTYEGLSQGAHVFHVRAIDTGGREDKEGATREWRIEAEAPRNVSPPTISGTAKEGETLSADGGTWTGTPELRYAYAWLRCDGDGGACGAIAAATGRTYRVTFADVGHRLRFEVTARNAGGSARASAVTRIVAEIDRTRPQTRIVAAPPNPTNRTFATFRFSSEPGSTFACRLDSGPFRACSSPKTYRTLRGGIHTFAVKATDKAGNREDTPASRRWRIDRTAPGKVKSLLVKAGDEQVRLTWTLPSSSDFARIVISRSPGGVVYRGKGTSFRDRRVRNGVSYRYAVRAYDRAGNRSGVLVRARPRDPLIAPRDGARFSSRRTIVFRWAGVRKATYYNLQLWRGTRKVLCVWPAAARVRLSSPWSYRGRRYRLSPGTYRWYVWPGFGSRTEARYASAIGTSVFVVRR